MDCNREQVQFHASGLDPGEVQDWLDQLQQLVPGRCHRLDPGGLPGGEPALDPQELGIAEDAVEWRAQFMRYHGDETRLCLVGLFCRFLGGAQFSLGVLAVGDLPVQRGVREGQIAQ